MKVEDNFDVCPFGIDVAMLKKYIISNSYEWNGCERFFPGCLIKEQ